MPNTRHLWRPLSSRHVPKIPFLMSWNFYMALCTLLSRCYSSHTFMASTNLLRQFAQTAANSGWGASSGAAQGRGRLGAGGTRLVGGAYRERRMKNTEQQMIGICDVNFFIFMQSVLLYSSCAVPQHVE